jgi:MFS family permease
MNTLKRIRRLAAVLAGLAGALVAFGATPAFAMHEPPPGSGVITSPVGATTTPVQVHTVVVGGMPGWQIALIAVVAALFAATVAVLADRSRSGRRKAIAATA